MTEQDAADPEGEGDRAEPEASGTDDAGVDPVADPDEDLVARVEETDPETVAGELAALRDRVAQLEAERDDLAAEADDLESRLARTKADFKNYKKRTEKRREEEKQRATEDLVERLLDVRDNLVRALEQEEGTDIRDGIEATLRQFDEELDRENVETVEPDPGTEVDPQRHEVLLRVESDRPEGTVAELHRPGYEMADKVIRAAQVTVSEGTEDGDDGTDDADGEAGDGTDVDADDGGA